ncbi:hypothetical protein ACFSJW_14420 [Flavobacterium artemisiae]|uniref:Uncharacterized protein n=1 Tax=Flavobacterium artemisiae TaxID=2126556 RepID=A0ABW4HGP2_9FLAO
MRNRNFITIGLLFFLSISLCGQNQNKKTTETIQTNKGMLFTLKNESHDCSYEVLVNDVPVVSYFGLGGGYSSKKEINQYMLQPGRQEITIRIYPQKKTEASFENVISKNAKVKITILKSKEPMSMLDILAAKEKGEQYEWQVVFFETSKIDADLPYKEFKTAFDVTDKDITWKIKGWAESKDLRNDSKLRQQVDVFYEKFKDILTNKKQQEYVDLLKTSIQEEALSKPWYGSDFGKDLANEMFKYAGEERNFIFPCQNAELKFYGNGKMVTLVCKDLLSYGYSPLISKTAKNAMPKVHTIYLHKSKNSDELKIIR